MRVRVPPFALKPRYGQRVTGNGQGVTGNVLDISVTTKKADGLSRLLEVTVSAEAVAAEEEKTARRYASSARLPGFRPGKAPTGVVKKKFADVIRQQTIEAVVQEAAREAMEREKVRPAGQPHVHDVHFDQGKPLVFELHLEVRPEIELPRLGGFKVRRNPVAVTEEHVREHLDQLREQRATWAPVEGKPQPGDMVTVTLATADETGDMPEPKEYRIVLGGGQAIPGIEELVMTLTPGESAERPVRWPEDFPDETQRGRTKAVRVSLRDVKRKSLPDLDDAFAREVGDFDSLAALTETVRGDLLKHAEREADADVRQKLLDEIIGANPFDVPTSWVDQLIGAYAEAYQIPEGERPKFAGEFRMMAERQVRRDLVIETVAEKHGLSATEADIDERIADVAQKRGAEPGQVYASLQKANRIREIERTITEEKVFRYLMDQSTIE